MDTVGAAVDMPREHRTCPMCKCKVVENAVHFVSQCAFYKDLRGGCQQKLREVIGSESTPALARAIDSCDAGVFLGDRLAAQLSDEKRKKWDSVIVNFLRLAWQRRETVWKTLTQPDNAWRLR